LLSILAALPATALPGAAWARRLRPVTWRGVALGADAQLTLVHHDEAMAWRAIGRCIDEIARLEKVFSLYEPESQVSRLNRQGHLDDPESDLLRLLSTAKAVSDRTGGAFDVTVQPLFAYHRRLGSSAATEVPATLRALVGYRQFALSSRRVGFRQPGMALTLNGIAQGYISDRVADLLRAAGFANALIGLGETVALGHDATGDAWRVAIADPDRDGQFLARLPLRRGALATSAPAGLTFDAAGKRHHLLEPSSGHSAGHYRSLTVLAPNATLADGLSTGLAVTPPDRLRRLLASMPEVGVLAVDRNGIRHRLGRLGKSGFG
jgi:thiamine biosynthesis lipoprotein